MFRNYHKFLAFLKTGCLMNNGEQEVSLRRSQQQRNYLMYHHDEPSEGNQNHKRIEGQSLISRDNRNRGGKRLQQQHAFNSAPDSNRRSRISSKNSGKNSHLPKKNRLSFKNRENHRQKGMFEIPECNPSTGCVNVTKTFATLGRTASMNCLAENLVGQKTVSLLI